MHVRSAMDAARLTELAVMETFRIGGYSQETALALWEGSGRAGVARTIVALIADNILTTFFGGADRRHRVVVRAEISLGNAHVLTVEERRSSRRRR